MPTVSSRRLRAVATLCVASLVAAGALVGCGGGSSGSDASASAGSSARVALTENDPSNPIQILSSEPSLVSGGNALVQIALPSGTTADAVKVVAAGNDMTSRFQEMSPGTLLGVVEGLPVGTSSIDVVPASGSGTIATVNVRNWPIEGPIISGPHQTPFFCQTQHVRAARRHDARPGARRRLLGGHASHVPVHAQRAAPR